MRETILERFDRILGDPRPVHGLKKEILEVEALEGSWIHSRLRKDELELTAASQDQL
jgi:hypothetical protein